LAPVRVLAEVAGVSLDALRAETAVRHVLQWIQHRETAAVGFVGSWELWQIRSALRGPSAKPSDLAQSVALLPRMDLLLPSDAALASALRRSGGLLAQSVEPAAFIMAILAGLSQGAQGPRAPGLGVELPEGSVGVVSAGWAEATAVSDLIRRTYPVLRLPVIHHYPPEISDPWSNPGMIPEDLAADCSEASTFFTLLLGSTAHAPVQSAVALAHRTGQVVLALSGATLSRLLPREQHRGLRMVASPTPYEHFRSRIWTRFFA